MHSSVSLSASSGVSSGHAPRDATDVLPSQVAKQSFEYVFPSSPHTGSQSRMQVQSAASDPPLEFVTSPLGSGAP